MFGKSYKSEGITDSFFGGNTSVRKFAFTFFLSCARINALKRRRMHMDTRKLAGLQPEAVFRYFEEICAIPHGSYNTKMISD